MININELEKVITSGKVVTLVIMVDGKELAAMSFSVDTVAFKEILEQVVKEPVKIADKVIAPEVNKTASGSKKTAKDVKKPAPVKEEKTEIIPPKEEVDEETGEIKPNLEQVKQFEDNKQPEKKSIEPAAASTLEDEPDPFIREEIIVTEKKETASDQPASPEIKFTEEQW